MHARPVDPVGESRALRMRPLHAVVRRLFGYHDIVNVTFTESLRALLQELGFGSEGRNVGTTGVAHPCA